MLSLVPPMWQPSLAICPDIEIDREQISFSSSISKTSSTRTFHAHVRFFTSVPPFDNSGANSSNSHRASSWYSSSRLRGESAHSTKFCRADGRLGANEEKQIGRDQQVVAGAKNWVLGGGGQSYAGQSSAAIAP